ncbi:MAG TPA: recombinase family protein [Thermoplasmata archaeon]|nr:recombinase family protein [Thermoplasmata archaeon]
MSETVLYARVSKGEDQDVETQLVELRAWAKATGTEAREVHDEISSRDRRPNKEEVLRLARLGVVGRIVVIRLDRWGRSLDELIPELKELAERGVELLSLREGFRLDSAAGRLYAHLLGTFAQFERDLIRERTYAGLARARSQGKIGGRHPVGCGCGMKPEGRPPHDGSIVPIRDGNEIVGWRTSDGRELPRRSKTNHGPGRGRVVPSGAVAGKQSGVKTAGGGPDRPTPS